MEHTNPDLAEMARRTTVLRTQVGSVVHRTTIEGTDDHGVMGVCVEPPERVIELCRFEQYVHRSAEERTKVRNTASGPR